MVSAVETPAPAPVASPPVAAEANPAPEPRRIRQAVNDFLSVFEAGSNPAQPEGQELNPFVAYTNLGTDFGFIGTLRDGVSAVGGEMTLALPPSNWVGMWHSLGGLASDKTHEMDFRACYPSFIKEQYQPKVIGVEFRARGKGQFKLEIKSATQEMKWQTTVSIDSPDVQTAVETVDPAQIGQAKFLNWVAEGGTQAALDSVGFIVQAPAIAFDEYVFLASYAKLARCFSPSTGYMRDRAHLSDAIFDNVPACGLFALSSALAARSGMVEEEKARQMLRQIHDNIKQLDTAGGWLPHFVGRNSEGKYTILRGTEFSVVDTSIYYHAMLLAAEILKDYEILGALTAEIRAVSLTNLVNADGNIRHGVRDDKITPLPAVWSDWGGETALVLALVKMMDNPPAPKMQQTGRSYDGTGFIPEIQSLFYPDFDSTVQDHVSNQNWMAVRQTMLERQKAYFPLTWPDSRAAQVGFYGLSAGEARYGKGYMVSGVDLPQQTFIHPHYVLMSGCTDPDPKNVYNLLRKMEDEQLFPPWGMVEHFTKDVKEYLPMQGALNAGFECLGAYHLMVKHRGQANVLYDASRANAELRKGVSIFYTAASVAVSNTGSSLTVR